MLRLSLVVATFAIIMCFALPATYAASPSKSPSVTYYGPSFVTPGSIPPDSPINVVLTTASCTSTVPANCITKLPSGGTGTGSTNNNNQDPACTFDSVANTWTCSWPQQSCTSASPQHFFYLIHEIYVVDPVGNTYMLGSGLTSGLFYPSSMGGSGTGTAVPKQAVPIVVGVGDSFTVPFGTGAGGFNFHSVLPLPAAPSPILTSPNGLYFSKASTPTTSAYGSPNPYYSWNPEGPYYWWTAKPNSFGTGQRLDKTSIDPTHNQGTYLVDIEGDVVCGNIMKAAPIGIFFDVRFIVPTPEFGTPIAIVAAISFVMLALMRRGMIGRRTMSFHASF